MNEKICRYKRLFFVGQLLVENNNFVPLIIFKMNLSIKAKRNTPPVFPLAYFF